MIEDAKFDALTQRLGTDRSWRWVVGGLIAAVASAAVFGESDAADKRHLAHGDYRGACINACPPGRCNVSSGEACCPPGSAQNTDSCAPMGGTCCGAGGFVVGMGAACCLAGAKATSCPIGQVCRPATSTNACAASVGAC